MTEQSFLDETDQQILKILQKDASLTSKEVAVQVNKSTAAVHERIRKLKKEGFIKKIIAILDRKKINKNLVAFCHVLLHNHSTNTLQEFESSVVQLPEVLECLQMTGAFDFILRVAVKDMDDYQDFYRNKLAALANVTTVQSFFILSEAKSDFGYQL
ncbi:DNA-binding transcriptional regulator, Lrp family [Arachidicoccus rhizosphaerae]|uniref:DNA-binding transcriptional regulator, Lrp family n=1 Tax=Arachidicoccus rhizosphaerae TaxID=551991 RepID=A0A1H4A509_9BACT|nr:Lrp/AsnC family transcriptional regulator [Arachidicoccus rhizosphaerae]SEA31055.1 DNA-binding transcriptional regulator, Lrp family [Arachidicoccus rhizosphaerae]